MILHLLLIAAVAVWGTFISLWSVSKFHARSRMGSILALWVGTLFGITLAMVMYVIRAPASTTSTTTPSGAKAHLDFHSPPTTRYVLPESPGGGDLSDEDLMHA